MIFLITKLNFGFHKIVRESDNCYYFKNRDGRIEGVLKRKWYVIKLWR